MTINAPSGKERDIVCDETYFPEFPELKFGTSIELGETFFDASSFLKSKSIPQTTITDFFNDCKWAIRKLQKSLTFKRQHVIGEQGQILININLVYLFLSYTDPDFLAYIFDIFNDVFTRGIAISDSFLLSQAKERLSKDILSQLANAKEM